MLILTRKPGERIILSNGVEIMLVAAEHGRARIGITAPPEVVVDREEVHLAKQSGEPAPTRRVSVPVTRRLAEAQRRRLAEAQRLSAAVNALRTSGT